MPDWNTVCNTPKSAAADSPWQNPLTASWDMQRTKWMKKKKKKVKKEWKETNNKKQQSAKVSKAMKAWQKTSKLSPRLLSAVSVCMQVIFVVLFLQKIKNCS